MYTDRFFYVKFINIHWIVLVGMGRVRLVVGGREKYFCFRNTNKTNVGFNLVWGGFYLNY